MEQHGRKQRSVPSPFESLAVCRRRSDIPGSAGHRGAGHQGHSLLAWPASSPAPSPKDPSQRWPEAPSLAAPASLARGGFLTIGDIWAGRDPGGHRHGTRGARQKHHLHGRERRGGPRATCSCGPAAGDTRGPGWGRREGGRQGRARLEGFPLTLLHPGEEGTGCISLPNARRRSPSP